MESTTQALRKRISHNRTLVIDTCGYARKVPLFPVEREFDLGHVADVRCRAVPRISWTALFMKAFACVAQQQPSLRQTFVRWPWPYLYEHHESVATVAIAREHEGEERLCWGHFAGAHRQSLATLQEQLDRYQHEPVEKVFHRQLRLSRLPWPLRHLAWRLTLGMPTKRAKRLGTFSISSLAGDGAVNRFHPTLFTTSLTYGPVNEQSRALVTLICDHRVLDGRTAAVALARLEDVMNTQIVAELSQRTLRIAA